MIAKNIVTLPPGTQTTLSGSTVTPRVRVGGDRLAQRQDARRRSVAVMAVAQRLHGGLDDVFGRLEVGLPDAEVDDVVALLPELLGAGEHLECGLGPEAGQIAGDLEHGWVPRKYGVA